MPPRRRGLPTLISNKGRIRNFSGFKYYPKPLASGEVRMGITNSSRRQLIIFVHRLVHVLFNDPQLDNVKKGDTVDHININPSDNDSSNLRWASKILQRRNQNHRSEIIPENRYRLRNESENREVDFSYKDQVAQFLGIDNESVEMYIASDDIECNGWKVWTLDNSFHIEGEVWKSIKDTRMSVSSLGRIGFGKRRRYYPLIAGAGYARIKLKRKNLFVHRVVAMAFIGKSDSESHEVDHIDRNSGNNAVDNIRYANRNVQNLNRVSFHKQTCLVEAKKVGSNSWIQYAGTRQLRDALGIKIKDVSNVLSPLINNKTAKGANDIRYEIRKIYDPTQEDLPGEEWKEVVFEDWDVGGKYYRIGEEP